jgi:K+-sensing histidine kinase KdpD
MTKPRILVPVHYPLSRPSIHTLECAAQLADERDAKEVVVLHVNLMHRGRSARRKEIEKAITQVLADYPVTLSLNESYLVEEAIRDEAQSVRADIIVLGKSQKAKWRRFLNHIVGNDIDIASFLRAHTDAEIIVVE